MGSYISSRFNNNQSTNGTNNNNNNIRKKEQQQVSTNLASYFYIAGKKYEILLDQYQPFLFGDKTDLNFLQTNKPVKVN
jgi:hypothetical protein